jgi:predicted methyltransferase
MLKIEVGVGYNDNGEIIKETLPAKFIVCQNCEGHGSVLNESMRGHCYTQDEFADAFDDEDDRVEYFKRGGKYDVQCPLCKGKNVVLVIADDQLTEEQKEISRVNEAFEMELHMDAYYDAMTMRGESGIYG